MTSLPLIGIVGNRITGKRIAGFPENLHDADIDFFFADYSRSVTAAGGLPVWLPIEVDPVSAADRLDGLLLTGGTDVDPARYGAAAADESLRSAPERDELELELAGLAIERDLAVLGICRGIQLLNVHRGGTLHQHVPAHARNDEPRDQPCHAITVDPDTRLHSLYGDHHLVNSRHHQAVNILGEGLRVSARADDGTIEAVELADKPVVGVQWHPEMMSTKREDPIFQWLISEASKRKATNV